MRILHSHYFVGAEKAIGTDHQDYRQHQEGCRHAVLAAQVGTRHGFQPADKHARHQGTENAVQSPTITTTSTLRPMIPNCGLSPPVAATSTPAKDAAREPNTHAMLNTRRTLMPME